jgi:hypothetical protein
MSPFYFLPHFAPIYLLIPKPDLVNYDHLIQEQVKMNNFGVDHQG